MLDLLNTPLAWLSQLVARINEHKSRHSLFSTCKLLRDLTMGQTDLIQCLLDIGNLNPAEAARSLQLLKQCKTGAHVKLVLQHAGGAQDQGCVVTQAAVFSSWLHMLCTQHGATLQPVTHVVLKAHVLDNLVPAALSTCCPRLTQITRFGTLLHLPNGVSVDTIPCQQLQHLTILDWPEDLSVQSMQQQLSRLPNLQSLHCELRCTGWRLSITAMENLMQCIQPVCTRLQSLELPNFDRLLLRSMWPQLQRLHLPKAWLYEQDVDLLLHHAPQVSDLRVGRLDLGCSAVFADRVCNWRDLHLTSSTCDSIRCLPLAGLRTIRIDGISLFDEDDWKDVQAVTDCFSCMGSKLILEEKVLDLCTADSFLTCESQIPQVLPLLQIVRQDHIKIAGTDQLNPLWLQVLGQLQCRILSLYVDDLWPDWWRMLLQQVPSLQLLQLLAPSQQTDSRVGVLGMQVTSFCAFAPRLCTLQIARTVADAVGQGWQQHLMATMQAAGHQHVSIQVVD